MNRQRDSRSKDDKMTKREILINKIIPIGLHSVSVIAMHCCDIVEAALPVVFSPIKGNMKNRIILSIRFQLQPW